MQQYSAIAAAFILKRYSGSGVLVCWDIDNSLAIYIYIARGEKVRATFVY